MIELSQVSLQRGPKFLLEQADLRIHPGHKLGLIGANGSGKSSLFQLLLGRLAADAGTVQLPQSWRIAHMAQEIEHTGQSALAHVLDGDAELRAVEQQIASAQGDELAHAYARMEQIDGYTAEARAQQLLAGLGFKPGDERKPVADFSGGWRVRLNLAQALMCRSDLLLLDEPTNHLDLDTTLWLEQWLKRYPGTLLLISHDRDFLDAVVDRIVNLEQQQLTLYQGNYSAYERQKAERLAQQQAAFEKQQARVAEIENFVRRFRAKATKARQAQSRLKELERMERIAPAHVDSPFHFVINAYDKISNPLINLQQVDIGYGQPLLKQLSLSILPGARIGLLGFNGAGKSTFIKALTGELPPLAGQITRGEHLRIGYFAQHQLAALDLDASPALHIQRLSPEASEQEIRTFLGSFGFIGDQALATVRPFSGGEKARLALALIAWAKPNLLLLDEPTNHLDLEVRHALTLALQAYEGAVIVVSHDRHLLRNTVDDFWLVDAGSVNPFDGDLNAYHQWTQSQQQGGTAAPSTQANTDSKVDKKTLRQQAALRREQLKPLTQALKKTEREMDTHQAQLAQLEIQLADNSLYEAANKARMNELFQQQARVREQLETLEARWLELSEQLEQLNSTDP